MKKSNVQNAVFGERKDFDSGQTESSFSYASKSVRGLNADDATFGVFKCSNKALGIKAGQSTGPLDGPNWRQGMLSKSDLDKWTDENPVPNVAQEQSKKFFVPLPKVDGKGNAQNLIDHAENVSKFSEPAKPLKIYSKREAYIAEREEQINKAMQTYHAKPKGKATGSEVLNSSGTTRRIQEAKVRAQGFGADLKSAEQDRRILANAKANAEIHPYTGKPMKPMQSVSTGKALDKERESEDQRKRFALHRENAKQNSRRNKYLRAKIRTETPKPKGITGFGVSKADYQKAISQVGEHAEAAQELRRFVPDHSRSWNKAGLRNPIQTHKRKQL